MPKTQFESLPRTNLDVTLQLILEETVQILSGAAGVLAGWNESRFCCTVSASYGLSGLAFDQLRPLLSKAVPRAVSGLANLRLLSEIIPSEINLPLSSEGVLLNPVLAQPLEAGGVFLGLFVVLRSSGASLFSASDQPILADFAEQAAVTIQNARSAHLLAEERQRLESMMENSPDGIMSIDSACRILGFNAEMEKLTGYSRQESIGKQCSAILDFRDFDGKVRCDSLCPMRETHPEGKHILERQGKIRTKNGRDVDVSIKYALALNPGGEPLNAVVSLRDISEVRKLENLRETFLAMLGHELQTPLAIIKGYSSALSKGQWNRKVLNKSLKIIEDESDNLSRVVNRLLLASRISSGTSILNKELVDLPNLAAKVVRRRRVLSRKHVFKVQMERDLPPLMVDPQMIEEVLVNLVDNALKYSPAGGNIVISGKLIDCGLSVTVSDQGIGISQESQKHLFERFYRVEQGSQQKIKGLGLGLYICKAIIEYHRGTISLSSQPGKGSQFTFILPLPEMSVEEI